MGQQHNLRDRDPQPQKPATYEDTRQFISDKIGMTPSVRKEDNIFQAKFVGVFLIVGMVAMNIVGPIWWDPEAHFTVWIIVGALFGLIAGTLISGAIIGVRNIWR